MIKIFFVTFFIAELIIAMAVILRIYQLDKAVNRWNNLILANQYKIKIGFMDFRFLLEEFNNSFLKFKDFIRQKRQEYLFKSLKTSILYGSIFLLKGRYKKTILAYQVIKEIYEGFLEAEE